MLVGLGGGFIGLFRVDAPGSRKPATLAGPQASPVPSAVGLKRRPRDWRTCGQCASVGVNERTRYGDSAARRRVCAEEIAGSIRYQKHDAYAAKGARKHCCEPG